MTVPYGCRIAGYRGYGNSEPTETEWSKHVAECVATAGAVVVPVASGAASNGSADTIIHTNVGIYFLEFKGKNTPVRGNQVAAAMKHNTKSLYSRGELVSFVYKAPDVLGVFRSDGTIKTLVQVDALFRPRLFVQELDMLAQFTTIGRTAEQIEAVAISLGMKRLQPYLYQYHDKESGSSRKLLSYTKALALRQLTGISPSSAISMGLSVEDLVGEL